MSDTLEVLVVAGCFFGRWVFRGCSVPTLGLVCPTWKAFVAYNYGLLWLIYGLLWSIVACYFGLLGVPGRLFGGIRSYCFGFWVPIIVPLSPKRIHFVPRGFEVQPQTLRVLKLDSKPVNSRP